MPHTAMHEHFGGSLMRTIGASEPLPLPFKPGCARLCYYTASTTGLQVQTPDARRLTPGSRPQYLVCCDPGGDDIDVYDGSGSPIDALTGGECLELILADNATAAGTWLARKFTFAAGTPLATNRQPLSFRFDTPRNDLAMLYHAQAHGWDGESPVALMVTIGAGVVIGSSSSNPADAALWIGGFPTGSTVVLMLEAGSYVSGRGGAGGRGGDAPSGLLAMNGLPGGLALSLGHPTALVSYGTIQGGGGGGGGGAHVGTQAGGGGGGGAGYLPSSGGQPGNGGGAFAGLGGTLTIAGGGGTGGQAGASGGIAGTAGGAAGGLGGAAGDAIEYPTGLLTKIRAGNIYGAEVAT